MKRLIVAAALLLQASAGAAQHVTKVSLATNDIVYDPVSARLYASIPSSAGVIAVINPATGVIENYIPVGDGPNRMAVSDDGRYLYVLLEGAKGVRRVELGTLTPGLQFPVGNDSSPDLYAQDLAVVPGNASAVAVVLRNGCCSGDAGVALFIDGTQLPDVARHSFYGSRTLAFASPTRLYGYDSATTAATFFRMNVTATGLQQVDDTQGLMAGSNTRLRYASGVVYGSNGWFSDPEARLRVATLSAWRNESLLDVAVDPVAGVAYSIAATTDGGRLYAYDLATWRAIWATPIPDVSTGSALVLAGSGRLAIKTTASQVVIIDTAGTQALRVAMRGTGDGVVSSSPRGISCGSDCAGLFPGNTTMTLFATPSSGSRFVRWDGSGDCADGVVTLTTGVTCTAVFERATPGPVRTIPVAANDVAFSSATGLLYVSVPSRDPVLGNSIAAIVPSTGAVAGSVWVGSEPTRLALSSDGWTLYVAVYGAFAVRRIDLSTLSAGRQFAVGRGAGIYDVYYAEEMAVVPGNPSAVAVVRRCYNSTADGGTALFVDGTVLPDVAGPTTYGSRALAFASSTLLYGQDDDTSLLRMIVTATGVQLLDQTPGLLNGGPLHLRYANGLAFDSRGGVVNAAAVQAVAQLWAGGSDGPLDVVPDTAAGLAYAISGSGSGYLRAFDLSTWRPLWALDLPNGPGTGSRIVLLGTNRVAFGTRGLGVVVVDTTGTRPLVVGKRGTGNGTVSTTPLGLSCGTECARLFAAGTIVTLSATPEPGTSFVRWDGDADCLDGSVTMTVPRSCSAVFARTAPGVMRRLPIAASDVVYSAATGLLYVSVPGYDPTLGNTVTSIDPSSGAILSSVWVGSWPDKLALSSDGLTLYVGLDTAGAVRPVNLATGIAGTQFSLGLDRYFGPRRALGLAVTPGDPSSVLVARSPDDYYDNSVARYSAGVLAATTVSTYATDLHFASPSVLYGTGESTGLVKMTAQAGGVVLDKKVSTFTSGAGAKYQNGRLFTATGAVIDPAAETQLGVFPLSSKWSTPTVCPDVPRGVVYFLERPSYTSLYLRTYDLDRFTPRQSVALSTSWSGAPLSFVTAGPGRLAFLTDASQLYLLSHVNAVAARPPSDFDGDLMADVAVFRPSTGTWFALNSSTDRSTFGSRGWGVEAEGDTPVIGDFDGDGVVDPAVFRPATGTWFILESHSGYTTWQHFGWGTSTDTLVPGDYDGDGATDGAVYRPSTGTWYVRPSSGAAAWQATFGGAAGDVPLTGDFDGDGITDPAIYRPSTGAWFWLKSSLGFETYDYRGWGMESENDVPIPADLDGDGKTDLSVFRPANGSWFVLWSKGGYATWSYFGWGQSGDTPVPADYDGDGITDAAVYRPSTGTWYIKPSSGLMNWSVVFGQAGDLPLKAIR